MYIIKIIGSGRICECLCGEDACKMMEVQFTKELLTVHAISFCAENLQHISVRIIIFADSVNAPIGIEKSMHPIIEYISRKMSLF